MKVGNDINRYRLYLSERVKRVLQRVFYRRGVMFLEQARYQFDKALLRTGGCGGTGALNVRPAFART